MQKWRKAGSAVGSDNGGRPFVCIDDSRTRRRKLLFTRDAMCKRPSGMMAHEPPPRKALLGGREACWREDRAPSVGSGALAANAVQTACTFARPALPRLDRIRARLSRVARILLGVSGSDLIRAATHVSPSLLAFSDWPPFAIYASEVMLLISRLWLLLSSAPQSSCQSYGFAVAWSSAALGFATSLLSRRRQRR